MSVTFDERFICVITATKKYLELVRKLEDVFDGIVLENMYDYPQYILNLLEEESEVNWDDNIWDLVYNGSEKETKQALYEIKKLKLLDDPTDETKRYKQKILDLMLAKGMMPCEAISLLDSRITEWNVFDWKTKYPNIEALVKDLLVGRDDD